MEALSDVNGGVFRTEDGLQSGGTAPPSELVPEIRIFDHRSYWDQGLRALMITDTRFLRNRHDHLATDTPQTLDYDGMVRVAVGVCGGLLQIAGA